jgi:hypothetical protein
MLRTCRKRMRWTMFLAILREMMCRPGETGIVIHLITRKWQRDPNLAGGVPQWGFSKSYVLRVLALTFSRSFDKFAPLGPMIVSRKVRAQM